MVGGGKVRSALSRKGGMDDWLVTFGVCGLKPSPPPTPCPPPPSKREAGELKLVSSLSIIDEGNKSFILCPLSFILQSDG